jgi:glycyl-tRNA synthetase beta chain
LYDKFFKIKDLIEKDLEIGNYNELFIKLIELRVPIDNFFDGVMVMDKNLQLKKNRLSLLSEIKSLFFRIADFSKLN